MIELVENGSFIEIKNDGKIIFRIEFVGYNEEHKKKLRKVAELAKSFYEGHRWSVVWKIIKGGL